MKKIFQIICIIFLMSISFFYSEKTVSVVKEYDTIMIDIKKNKNKYIKEVEEPIIIGNTIIPGISGIEININESYSKMKRYGKYEESLLKFKKIYPKNTIKNNKNNYIVRGNKNKGMISFIFIVENNDKIDDILNILENKKVKANFFIDGYWMEKNTNIIPNLIKKKYIVGNLGYSREYINKDIGWMEDIIEKIGKQKEGYCYLEKKNEKYLDICQKNNNYTIIPNLIINNNPYIEIKKRLESGNMISFKINNQLIEELPIIINYIKSRGYKITTLKELLSE